ncbi:hypothetical protein SEUCBS139899_003612 [Sporothrix eucalyptigena]|uniref:Carboxylesterase type B domain-containing protein n=1 Tax=Sporothrix eucalyptigena TaxID=1812306 RepID=A0ABP0C9M9_9PEZI
MHSALLLGSAALVSAAPAMGAMFDPYFANLTFEAPRTLSNWSNLTVATETGTFIGMYNDTYPNVRQFLRIPYAQPPVGDLRWEPPRYPHPSRKRIDSTYFGPMCPQFVSKAASVWNSYEPTNEVINPGEKLDAGMVAWNTAEDCLTLAVWTPAYANISSKLPVAIFVTGGGGTTGGVEIASQLPANWVSRSQEHITVTINYRNNIFGKPGSRALKVTSLTLLDVRAAVEWVHININAFGGDRENIMLFGQSEGAGLVNQYTLAFPEVPLANKFGMLSQPASQIVNLTTDTDPYEPFDILAKSMGCNYGDDYEAELECMRQQSWVEIVETINNWNATPAISTFYLDIPDEKYIFSNESERYALGKVAPGPAIRSNAAAETSTANNETATAITAQAYTCKNYDETLLRESIGLDTYRYFWAGNFTNISPVYWIGALHWSDLLMIFGTYMTDVGDNGNFTSLEIQTSQTMQDYFLAFVKNPSTVNTTVGWPKFDSTAANGGQIVEFGKDVPAQLVTGDYIEGSCWNSSIPYPLHG